MLTRSASQKNRVSTRSTVAVTSPTSAKTTPSAAIAKKTSPKKSLQTKTTPSVAIAKKTSPKKSLQTSLENSSVSDFWNIPDINEVHNKNLKKLQNNLESGCISSAKMQELPFFADAEDMRSLQKKELLTSVIINMYANFIQEQTSNNTYIILNSELYYHFVHALKNKDDLEGFKEGYLKPLQGNLANKKIILPINLDNEHWIFSMFVPKDKKIYILDPYHHVNKNVFDNLKILWTIQGHEPNINYEPIYIQENLPKQGRTDNTSCGIFTSMNIAYLLYLNRFPTKHDFKTVDIPKIRKYIFNIIINKVCKF